MIILNIDPLKPNINSIKTAANLIARDGIVIYPTDTAYGIGVNATSVSAIKKLYELKGRSLDKPTHFVARGWDMMKKYSHPTPIAYSLFKSFLPGPLTLVVDKNIDLVPNELTGGLSTVGIRIPDSQTTTLLSSLLPFPYTTPSANRTGETTPFSITDVRKVLDISKVDLVLDAGELVKNKPSTLVDTTNDNIKIIREGPISKEQIEKVAFDKLNIAMR